MTLSDRLPSVLTEALQACGIAVLFHPQEVKKNGQDDAIAWLVTDFNFAPLHPRLPLIEEITAARGIGLCLLQYDAPTDSWHHIREVRRSTSCKYAIGIENLAHTLCQLLQQALVDFQLGSAVLPRENVAITNQTPLKRPAWTYRLQGFWNHWISSQTALWFSEFWRIGVIDASRETILRSTELPPIRWITSEQTHGYWADPFSFPSNEKQLVCEYFDEQLGVGFIEELALDEHDTVTHRKRLPVGDGKHVSFPYVFTHEGKTLAVPESLACNQCDLFEIDVNGTWHFVSTLLPNVQAADPVIFLHEGRWWLAFTDAAIGSMDNLCLYYADRLEGPWSVHANNPVKIDICGARMAGPPFMHEGQLHRSGQVCLPSYGSAIAVYRIDSLTPTTFAETLIKHIQPDPSSCCPDGLHTLSPWGNRTLVDGKRHGINYRSLLRKLVRRTTFGKNRLHERNS